MELSSLLNPEDEQDVTPSSEHASYFAISPSVSPDTLAAPTSPDGHGHGEGSMSPGSRKYTCTLCTKSFSTSGHLSRHLKVHSGERNFACPFPSCDVRCNRSDNLLQHYRVHLPKEPKMDNAVVREELSKMQALAASSQGSHAPHDYNAINLTSYSTSGQAASPAQTIPPHHPGTPSLVLPSYQSAHKISSLADGSAPLIDSQYSSTPFTPQSQAGLQIPKSLSSSQSSPQCGYPISDSRSEARS